MNKIINTLLPLLLILAFSHAQIISVTATPPYTQTAVNLTNTTTDIQLEIVNCLQLLSTGNFIDQNTTITKAILRVYSNKTRQYYLYFQKNDTSVNSSSLQQFQAIIRLESSTLYNLLDFLTMQTLANGTSSLVSYANYIVSPPANTLTEVATNLTNGYTLLNSTQIAADDILQAIDQSIRKLYGLDSATLSFAASTATSVKSAFQGYRLFYSSDVGTSNFKFRIASAVYNSEAKVYYIHDVLEIRLPSYITL